MTHPPIPPNAPRFEHRLKTWHDVLSKPEMCFGYTGGWQDIEWMAVEDVSPASPRLQEIADYARCRWLDEYAKIDLETCDEKHFRATWLDELKAAEQNAVAWAKFGRGEKWE